MAPLSLCRRQWPHGRPQARTAPGPNAPQGSGAARCPDRRPQPPPAPPPSAHRARRHRVRRRRGRRRRARASRAESRRSPAARPPRCTPAPPRPPRPPAADAPPAAPPAPRRARRHRGWGRVARRSRRGPEKAAAARRVKSWPGLCIAKLGSSDHLLSKVRRIYSCVVYLQVLEPHELEHRRPPPARRPHRARGAAQQPVDGRRGHLSWDVGTCHY